MSKISGVHKVENMNKTALQRLQNILEFCEKSGHQPEPDSEFGKIMNNLYFLVIMRNTKGIAVPEEITSLFEKIKTFPTAAKHKRKELEIKETTRQIEQQQKYERIQNLTSHNLKIFKFVCGAKKFKRFLNTDIDPIATKAVLDYFYAIYYNQHFSPVIGKSFFSLRIRRFIELYVGDYTGKNIDDLKATLEERVKEKHLPKVPEKDYQKLIAKIENKEPLKHKEIGYLHYLTSERVRFVLYRTFGAFHATFRNFESLLDSYIDGDASAVMSKIPEKLATLYKYQQENNMQDIPTDVLNRTGKTLMGFFAENISTKQH